MTYNKMSLIEWYKIYIGYTMLHRITSLHLFTCPVFIPQISDILHIYR